MRVQRRANPRVWAGHGHGDLGPVTRTPACPCEHLDRAGRGIFEYGGQVADHAAGPVGQGQPDREVQIGDDIAEPAGHLKDNDRTHNVCSDPPQ